MRKLSAKAFYWFLINVICGRNMTTQSDLDLRETALKEDLKFYFMNPCEKYRARRQIPWKLALQILKILMVTTQVILCFYS